MTLSVRMQVLSTKNTILKAYDGMFLKTFRTLYETQYKPDFDRLGLDYDHRLIDDQVCMSALRPSRRHED
jgi:isocitrate dehydrogenase